MHRGTRLGLLVAALVVCSPHAATASECYDHYNPAAWNGQGLAIVFCRNNSDSSQSSFFTQCELRQHDGATLQGLTRHGSLDDGRVVYTDYDTTGAAFDFDIDVVCQDAGGTTHTFFLGNGAQAHTGCCRYLQCGSIDCCGTGCSSGTGGAGGSGGSSSDAGVPVDTPACPTLASREYSDAPATLDEPLGSNVRLTATIDAVPDPGGLVYAALSMRLHDADHPGEEGFVYVNGSGPLTLPAATAWNDVDADAVLVVPVEHLVVGTNLVEFGVGTLSQTVYSVSRVALDLYGPACDQSQDAGTGGSGAAGGSGAGSPGGSGVGGAGGPSSGGQSAGLPPGGSPPTDGSNGCGCGLPARRSSLSMVGALGVVCAVLGRRRRGGHLAGGARCSGSR